VNGITRRYLEQVAPGPPSWPALAGSRPLDAAYQGRFLSRPAFLDAEEILRLDADLNQLYDLLVSVPGRLFGGDVRRYAAAVGMNAAQIEAILRLGTEWPVRVGRADLYREPDGFKLLEFNLSTALGGLENGEINKAMLDSPALADFVARERLAYHDTLAGVARTLLRAGAHSQAEARPVVAIIDAPASFAHYERRWRELAVLLSGHGVDAFACHAGEVTTEGGHLVADGRVIDVVYRYFILEDLLPGVCELELFEPILRAHERGTVTVFAPLDTELYGNKQALALLSDDRCQDALGAAERALVDRLLPWTRVLRDCRTTAGAGEVDLLAYCREHRADLVLKPTLLHGGDGVRPGWRLSDDDWREALGEALGQGHVVQRRVRPCTEPFFDESAGTDADTVLTWGVFLDDAGYDGAYVRGCHDPDVGVVSMGAGARVGCCFSRMALAGDLATVTG